MFGIGLEQSPVPESIKRLVVNGILPALAGGAGFQGKDFFHNILPSSAGQRRVAVLQINLRDLQIHFRMLHGFIFGIHQTLGFDGVARSQALPFFGVGVKTAIGVATAAIN